MKVLKKRSHTDGKVLDSLPPFYDFKLKNNDIKKRKNIAKKESQKCTKSQALKATQ